MMLFIRDDFIYARQPGGRIAYLIASYLFKESILKSITVYVFPEFSITNTEITALQVIVFLLVIIIIIIIIIITQYFYIYIFFFEVSRRRESRLFNK